jgi:hypothetical protein
MEYTETYTLTFGDRAENHAGMQQIGDSATKGFTLEDLLAAQEKFEAKGYPCKIYDLNYLLGDRRHEGTPAYLLVVRQGLECLLDRETNVVKLFNEQRSLEKDSKMFIYGQVRNKIARHNLCFAEFSQDPDYENKKGTVIPFSELKYTNQVREHLSNFLGKKARKLVAEGNYYYDSKKCYCGFHGDAERMIVCAVRLGADFPLHYQWYEKSAPVGQRLELILSHSDIYFMSEKAVGTDWKKSSILTLRHAAGSAKALKLADTPLCVTTNPGIILEHTEDDDESADDSSLENSDITDEDSSAVDEESDESEDSKSIIVRITIDGQRGTSTVCDFLSVVVVEKLKKWWGLYQKGQLTRDQKFWFEPSGDCCGQTRCYACDGTFEKVTKITFKPRSGKTPKGDFGSDLRDEVFERVLECLYYTVPIVSKPKISPTPIPKPKAVLKKISDTKIFVTITIEAESGTIIVHNFVEPDVAKMLEKEWTKYKKLTAKQIKEDHNRWYRFAPEGGCCGQTRCFVCTDVFGRVKDITFEECSKEKVETIRSMINFECDLQKKVFGIVLDFDEDDYGYYDRKSKCTPKRVALDLD